MIASLFFRAGGTISEFDVDPVVGKFKISEGIKLSLPCVQTALFFTSVADDDGISCSFMPQNWGIRVFGSGKETSVSPPSSLSCDFAMGRISVSGPLSELKQPVPAFGKRWNVKQLAAIKVKGGLPDVDAGKKPLSVCASLNTGVFFAGFAAVGLKQSATSEFSAPTVSSCDTDSLGADILLVQLGFSPEERSDFSFYTSCTFTASALESTGTSRWFSVSEFRPDDTRFLMLNDSVLIKSWNTLSVAVQNSFAAGISRHKSGIECWNNTLLCLSCGKFYTSMGFFCSDFGFTTSSGTDIRNPLRLYGSLAYSFSAVGVKFDIYASFMTGTSYAESLPAEKRVETSARTGFSASYGELCVSADGAVKNLCPQDAYTKSTLEVSFETGFSGGSVQWKGETPLIKLSSDGSAFKWEVSVKPDTDWTGGISGSVSGKFCGTEFASFGCKMSYSIGALKIAGEVSVSAEKKLTWACSAQMKI
ncbi:MAG: hypothetical protein J5647_10045 [Spirochaetaceae bacterium]|nr:hypothetical protein [Spirochaetaceae bacterium]